LTRTTTRKKTARHDDNTNYNNYLPTDRKKVTCVFVSCRFVGGGGQQSLAPASRHAIPSFFGQILHEPAFFPSLFFSVVVFPSFPLAACARTHARRKENERTNDRQRDANEKTKPPPPPRRTHVRKERRTPASRRAAAAASSEKTNERTNGKKKKRPTLTSGKTHPFNLSI